jgi:hypothetical protein
VQSFEKEGSFSARAPSLPQGIEIQQQSSRPPEIRDTGARWALGVRRVTLVPILLYFAHHLRRNCRRQGIDEAACLNCHEDCTFLTANGQGLVLNLAFPERVLAGEA